jgi:hypothetical protein
MQVMEFAEELRACRVCLSSGTMEIRESGGRVTSTALLSWEVRGSTEKPLLVICSENCNLTRRVLAITDRSEPRLALALERFGRSRPDLELKATENSDLPLQAADTGRESDATRHRETWRDMDIFED